MQPRSETARERNLREVAERFPRETAHHQMTVLHDDGLYRHVRFRNPEQNLYWFDLVTWPGYLSFTGDMPGYTFTRERDMFAWFRMGSRHGISPDYWGQKLVNERDVARTWSEDACREHIADTVSDYAGEHPGLWRDVKAQILDCDDELQFPDSAIPLLRDYTYTYTVRADHGRLIRDDRPTVLGSPLETRPRPEDRRTITVRPFQEAWEWELRDWDWSFLWACHAIAWGIGQYVTVQAAAVPVPVPA